MDTSVCPPEPAAALPHAPLLPPLRGAARRQRLNKVALQSAAGAPLARGSSPHTRWWIGRSRAPARSHRRHGGARRTCPRPPSSWHTRGCGRASAPPPGAAGG
eukprot:4193412-Prorocentrum_lima.AAC.1